MIKRRQFISACAASVAGVFSPISPVLAKISNNKKLTPKTSPIETSTAEYDRYWLGASFWANRLQDWKISRGKITTTTIEKGNEARTVSLLTRSLIDNHSAGRIRLNLGMVDPNRTGFSGILLGVGAGKLDYRSSALAQRFGGKNGGFMAVIDEQGKLSFRDFSNQSKPMPYTQYEHKGKNTPFRFTRNSSVSLDCSIVPTFGDRFDIHLIAVETKSNKEIGHIVRSNVPASELLGGIMLVSSSHANSAGSRWWFSDIETGGEKIGVHPERKLGPVLGCMYSVNKDVLKLTAQLFPISLKQNSQVSIAFKKLESDTWIQGLTSPIEDGFVATFRIPNWDANSVYQYRVYFPENNKDILYEGEITNTPPPGQEFKIALFSCMLPTAKSLDDQHYKKNIPQERLLGRYTPDNILFPHTKLVDNCETHKPDLYVFCGDQYYETYPTRYGRHTKDAKLDTLYRWYLWYWTFRDSLRNRPAILIVDDHDILQGNLWGNGGVNSDKKGEESGGYKWDLDLVKMIHRIQANHNPDPYEKKTIKGGIPVLYSSFVYGDIDFAIVEDRKFKSPPDTDISPSSTKGHLLGTDQERFLSKWAESHPNLPKVCLTASIWGSPQTKEDLTPLLDYDANGYPPDGRTRAVQLIKRAGAIVLCGDQHLGMVATQGIHDFEDGPTFFAGPAAAAFWQRWFEADSKLENKRNNDPNTGNFTDTFGNKMRVLAVANPRISHHDFQENNKSWGKFLADHKLKSEGYGIVRIDRKNKEYIFECWPWDEDPKKGQQFNGWPYHGKFV